jgi:hypothetical protein
MNSSGYTITLTARPHGAVTAELVRNFNASWRSWLQWLKRELGVGRIEFSWVLERGGRTGHLHRHAVVDTRGRSFSYRRARAALVRCGMGSVCNFRPILSQQAARAGAAYIGKYLSKHLADPRRRSFPAYSRRCQTTIPKLPPLDDQEWHFYPFWSRGAWSAPARAAADPKMLPRMLRDDDPRVLVIGLTSKQGEKLRHGTAETPAVEAIESG